MGDYEYSDLLRQRRAEIQQALQAIRAIVPAGADLGSLNSGQIQAILAGNLSSNLIPVSQKGIANGVATLGLDGKVPAGQLPTLIVTDTFVVSSQAEMLALTAERGDMAIRSDLSKTFVLVANDATVLSNWIEMLVPGGGISSVFGRLGPVVSAQAGDYNASQVTNTPAGSLTATDVQDALNDLDTRLTSHSHAGAGLHYFEGNCIPGDAGDLLGLHIVPAGMSLSRGWVATVAPPSGDVNFQITVAGSVVASATIAAGNNIGNVSVVAPGLFPQDLLQIAQVNDDSFIGRVAWSLEGSLV